MRTSQRVKDNVMAEFTFKPIGYIRSCFTEKFGIPRQPGLVPDATAVLEIKRPFQNHEAFRNLESFSHIWILFVFHQCLQNKCKSTVRPPRLGGNRRVGVFASRSGFRPNPIGQSAVELVSIEKSNGRVCLYLKGVDLLDGTPVLDIKPYLPYADSLPQAKSGYAGDPPPSGLGVHFSKEAAGACRMLESQAYPHLERLIIDLLAMDPRPGYADAVEKRSFGMRLWDLNIRFKVVDGHMIVESIIPAKGQPRHCEPGASNQEREP
jgi:tRNA-Thr(GGU) m(6)t(6)A37 methyltransferase TsaA